MTTAPSKPNRLSLTVFLKLLKQSFKKLGHNDPLRMAGATAFFTSFALPFILIILTSLLGLFYDKTFIRSELYQTMRGMLGLATMQQVTDTLRAFRELAHGWVITIGGISFLFLVSTTLLMVIKKSINQLWRIRVVSGTTIGLKLIVRLQSIMIILGTGFLFFISILTEGMKAHIANSVNDLTPELAYYFIGASNYLFSLLMVTLWFALIFRYLPDARAPWKIALTGAFLTSILFNLGKYLLRIFLINSNIGSLYGASASIVLLLLFVFYTSLIMYFGAVFTRVWARHKNIVIKPMPYARHYTLSAIDADTDPED